MRNPITFKLVKRVVILAGFGFCFRAISDLDKQRKKAVDQLNTFTSMFGSLANFVGDDVVSEWHKAFTGQLEDVDEDMDENVFVVETPTDTEAEIVVPLEDVDADDEQRS